MGHQDGVDVVVRAADLLVNEWGYDVTFALLGFGDTLEALKALTVELGLEPSTSPSPAGSTPTRSSTT